MNPLGRAQHAQPFNGENFLMGFSVSLLGGTCPEADKLLRIASSAAYRHSELVGRLSESAGIGDHEGFAVISSEVHNWFLEAKAAWNTYRQHVAEHGC
jgi:hypothetical protein